MLILVGVTVSTAINGGLLGWAKNAAVGTNEAIDEESFLANGGIKIDGKTYASMDDYLKGKETGLWYYCMGETDTIKSNEATNYITNGIQVITVGAIINNFIPVNGTYTINTNTGMGTGGDDDEQKITGNNNILHTKDLGENWYVLGVGKDGLLEITSTHSTDYTEEGENEPYLMCLSGKKAYGLEALNDICNKLYGKSGTGASYARSIREEDIAKLVDYDKTTYNEGNSPWEYGRKWTYRLEGGKIYVNTEGYEFTYLASVDLDGDGTLWYDTGETSFEYYDENKGWIRLGDTVGGQVINSVEFIAYAYECYLSEEMDENHPLKHILSENTYWLASPFVSCNDSCVYFNVPYASEGGICMDSSVFVSYGDYIWNYFGLRPVVSLSSNVSLNGNNVDGYTIEISE